MEQTGKIPEVFLGSIPNKNVEFYHDHYYCCIYFENTMTMLSKSSLYTEGKFTFLVNASLINTLLGVSNLAVASLKWVTKSGNTLTVYFQIMRAEGMKNNYGII